MALVCSTYPDNQSFESFMRQGCPNRLGLPYLFFLCGTFLSIQLLLGLVCMITSHLPTLLITLSLPLTCLSPFLLPSPVDNMFEQILYSSSSKLAEAREILQNITCRRLYKCVGQTQTEVRVEVSQVCVCVCVRVFGERISFQGLLAELSTRFILCASHPRLLFPQKKLLEWAGCVARSRPRNDLKHVTLQPEDFVVHVSVQSFHLNQGTDWIHFTIAPPPSL